MSEFRFRLQRVLEYRQMVEGWAKDAFLEARAARLEAVAHLEKIEQHRGELMCKPADTLEARLAMQNCFDKLDMDEQDQRIVLSILEGDEAKRKEDWTEARKELQALEKLRDKAKAEWDLEERRKEQRELDEWAVMQKAA